MIHKFNIKVWKRVPKDNISIYPKYEKLKNDYYKVIVSDTYEEMYDIVDKIRKRKEERNYNGFCESEYTIYVDGSKSNKVGHIFLVKDVLGAGTIAHECSHAITYYFDNFIKHKEKIFGNSQYNETFAYMVGSLVYQIYDYLFKNKILE